MSADIRVVLCTFADRESGLRVARSLVEERLAACAQLDSAPVESIYWWQGEVRQEQEYRLVVKTWDANLPALRARIAALHPYEVPQIVDLAADANEAYARWLRAECRSDPT